MNKLADFLINNGVNQYAKALQQCNND